MSTSTKYDVFISYSRRDYVDEYENVISGNEVSKIKKALAANGIKYWFDEDGIYSGQNFSEIIVEDIEASKVFVFLSTRNSNNSKWTSKEIATADEFGKHIIPVRIDDTPYNKSVMFRIADLDFIEYYKIGSDAGITKLVSSINKALDEVKKQEELELEKRRKAEVEARRKEIQGEIRTLQGDVYALQLQEKELLAQIADKKELIDENKIICPVCNAETDCRKTFCNICGWTFNCVEDLLSGEDRTKERKRVGAAKTLWAQKEKLLQEQRQHDSCYDKLNDLEKACASTEAENTRLKQELHGVSVKSVELKECLNKRDEELRLKSKLLVALRGEKSKLENEKLQLQQALSRAKNDNAELTKKLKLQAEDSKKISDAYSQAKQELYAIVPLKNKIKQLEEELKEKDRQIQQHGQENDSYDVILINPGSLKLMIVKTVKETLGVGLKEAKDLVDSVPSVLVSGVDKCVAMNLKLALCNHGAVVEIMKSKCYNVVLKDSGPSKLAVVKIVKETLGIGLKEAKDLVDLAPGVLAEGVDLKVAMELKNMLCDMDAIAEVV